MAEFPVVLGYTLRATTVNKCGRPESGAANRLVTEGFVSVNLQPVMREAEDLEQKNAQGKICVSKRTPAERKWWTVEATFCNVNTELITMFTGWERVVDYAALPVGLRDKPEVSTDYGVALELWTGGQGADDCALPITDDVFSAATSGDQYGYFLFGGKEFTLGGIEIGEQVSTFTISGITMAMPQWGRGPYNVAALDSAGTPGRLLQPTGKKEHVTLFRTGIKPPAPTNGAVPLSITGAGKFTGTTYYFGGPAGAAAAVTAPSQDEVNYTVVLTGVPTAGNFGLVYTTLDGQTSETATILWNETTTAFAAKLAALNSLDAADVVVGGTVGNWTVKILKGGTLAKGVVALTGGTTPNVTVTKV